jgi:radical SAM superfamily enzyme YgiQ (UPF0313 family)
MSGSPEAPKPRNGVAGPPRKILLVSPEFPRTYWGLQYGVAIAGRRATMPPLGLITVAALLPRHWRMRLVDMNIEPLTDADLTWADAVLVGGMLIQAPSMRAVVHRARALGRRTVVGGPGPSTSPRDFAEADVVFGGEAEGRVAELVALIEGATPAPQAGGCSTGTQTLVPLRKEARPDVKGSPVPRFDLLRMDAYTTMSIQYSRGCPYRCEFCDIIEIFGRVPRLKTPAQVLTELDALCLAGWRGSVFVVDDNFIGNVKELRKLLPELRRWQTARGWPLDFYTEASVNIGNHAGLIEAMASCAFTGVFLGIETPSPAALAETKKTQNIDIDLRQIVDDLTRAGMEVMAGFIVGFDSDDVTAFEAQRTFLEDAPIPLAMVGLLTALPDTALWRRLAKEGRLRKDGDGENFGRPNFTPTMDEEALLAGYMTLLRQLYSLDGYLRRCRAVIERLPVPHLPARLRPGSWRIFARTIWRLGVKSPRRRLFWSLVGMALRRSLRHMPWAVEKAIQGEHFLRYTAEDVMPRLREAIADVRAERVAALPVAFEHRREHAAAPPPSPDAVQLTNG